MIPQIIAPHAQRIGAGLLQRHGLVGHARGLDQGAEHAGKLRHPLAVLGRQRQWLAQAQFPRFDQPRLG